MDYERFKAFNDRVVDLRPYNTWHIEEKDFSEGKIRIKCVAETREKGTEYTCKIDDVIMSVLNGQIGLSNASEISAWKRFKEKKSSNTNKNKSKIYINRPLLNGDVITTLKVETLINNLVIKSNVEPKYINNLAIQHIKTSKISENLFCLVQGETLFIFSPQQIAIKGESGRGLFEGFQGKGYNNLDLQGLDVSEAENFDNMFNDNVCLRYLNVDDWDTSNVRTMTNMFANCHILEELNIGHFDTSKVINMENMLKGCRELVQLDVSNWAIRSDCKLGICGSDSGNYTSYLQKINNILISKKQLSAESGFYSTILG